MSPPDDPAPDCVVLDDQTASRFELRVDGRLVSLADYSVDGDVVTVPHVETDPAHREQGYAAALMAKVIESIRQQGQTIRPLCPFAAQYMRERPETHDLVAR